MKYKSKTNQNKKNYEAKLKHNKRIKNQITKQQRNTNKKE
jgi:hypothetical protein